MASRLHNWLDSRLNLAPIERSLLDEPIPGGASWIYVFGSATLFLFCLQATTGMFLALYYVPSPDAAYDTVQFIQHEVQFGWFVRGLHHWGASAVMAAIGLHLLQVYLYGAYKRPRELMWMVGVGLLLLMLTFGFTGYLLPWDQNAYWATQVGTNMVASVPLVGDLLVRLLRGGETLGALTLSRFFAVHTLFLPALIVSGIVLHLFILRRVGPAGPWNVEQARHRREPFYPRQVYMDAVVMLAIFLVVAALAFTIEFPLADRADPSDHTFTPVPEWYFLFFYQLLKYMSGPLEPLATWVLPGVVILGLLLLPFLDRNPERRPRSRPIVLTAGAVFLSVVLGLLGTSLWQLHRTPKVDPSVARGKALFAHHHCTVCHRLHGEGGQVGPDLSYVGERRPDREWHLRHFRDPKSVSPGSIMPTFALSDREMNDLASFLLSLKGAGTEERKPVASASADLHQPSTPTPPAPRHEVDASTRIARNPTKLPHRFGPFSRADSSKEPRSSERDILADLRDLAPRRHHKTERPNCLFALCAMCETAVRANSLAIGHVLVLEYDAQSSRHWHCSLQPPRMSDRHHDPTRS